MKVIWSIELVLLALLALIQPLQAKDWPKEPLADVQQAAERGDADAQFSLGFRYDNGLGVPQDAAQAVVWYRKPPSRGMLVHNSPSGRCMPPVKVRRRTTSRRMRGHRSLLRMEMLMQ